MDLDSARELIKNRFPMNDIEKLHELYGKPFDIKTGITGTDKPDCGFGSLSLGFKYAHICGLSSADDSVAGVL